MKIFIFWLHGTLVEAINLEMQNLCWVFSSKHIVNHLSRLTIKPHSGWFIRLSVFFGRMISSIWLAPFFTKTYPSDALLFFAATSNDERALKTLAEQTPNSWFIGTNGYGTYQIPIFWAYLFSIPFFPLLVYRYVKSVEIERLAFNYVLNRYWVSYGYYILMRWLFHKNRPATVIVSNDHIMWTRVLLKAAHDENVSTVYLQHASVTAQFPPLSTTLALLEGRDAAEKYKLCGESDTVVHLVGLPRFDKYHQLINNERSLNRVGVCVNLLDALEDLQILGKCLRETVFDVQIVLRPHPSDRRIDSLKNIANMFEWEFSDGRTEDAFQFLSNVDAIVAGDSNILLEAALLNVLPIYYDFSGNYLDWYGFHKNGLVEYFSSPQKVAKHIMDIKRDGRPYVRTKAKLYCDTIETIYDGRSIELCIDYLTKYSDSAI